MPSVSYHVDDSISTVKDFTGSMEYITRSDDCSLYRQWNIDGIVAIQEFGCFSLVKIMREFNDIWRK